MIRRAQVWLAVALLFLVVNLGGAGWAAAQGELPHAGLHVGLALLGAYLLWRLAPGRAARRVGRQGEGEVPAAPSALADRLTYLEQSVDTVAVEVERIGEGQRFMTRLFTEPGTPAAPGEGAAGPRETVETTARETAPHGRRS